MKIHVLKIMPEYFEAVLLGAKTFEIRKNDRDFKKNDWLKLMEYKEGEYTGRDVTVQVKYVLSSFEAITAGYVVMSISTNLRYAKRGLENE